MSHPLSSLEYQPDILGEGYEQATLEFPPDTEGTVVATLIRKKADQPTSKAVLYIHGFIDYFFQTEMAERFNQQGFDFYALDLRKYGRSYLSHQKLYNVYHLSEYDAEISQALEIIGQEGHDTVLLSGHSTGGLITTLYAVHHPDHPLIKGLWLNSPFYDFNMTPFEKKFLVPKLSRLGKRFPEMLFPSRLNRHYVPSLHISYQGEWHFDLEWKKPSYHWVRLSFVHAIHEAQKEIHQGVRLSIPTLLMHAHKTTYPLRFNRNTQTSDVILQVRDMIEHAQKIQGDVQLCSIQNGIHDLVLSEKPVREQVYQQLFQWLENKAL